VIGAVVAATFALTATPSRIELAGSGSEVVEVRNRGTSRVVVDATCAGFALDLTGRPRVVAAAPAAWLSVRPKRVAIAPGRTATLRVNGRVLRGASPGDHTALLLLSTRPTTNAGVAVRMRLGVVVVLRVPGRVVHRLSVPRVSIARGLLRVTVANRGNVTEQLTGTRIVVTVRRGVTVLARLSPTARELLPHSSGVLTLRLRRSLPRATGIDVTIRAASGAPMVSRSFRPPVSGPRAGRPGAPATRSAAPSPSAAPSSR
jgi:hypothetical protein